MVKIPIQDIEYLGQFADWLDSLVAEEFHYPDRTGREVIAVPVAFVNKAAWCMRTVFMQPPRQHVLDFGPTCQMPDGMAEVPIESVEYLGSFADCLDSVLHDGNRRTHTAGKEVVELSVEFIEKAADDLRAMLMYRPKPYIRGFPPALQRSSKPASSDSKSGRPPAIEFEPPPRDPGLEKLIAAAQDGDKKAFEKALKEHWRERRKKH
jgi:hypothetical protein